MTSARKLGLWSGVGIVIANMIGAGVLTTPGFMAMSLAPSYILLAWLVGGIAALSGARARRGRCGHPALGRRVPLPLDAVASDARLSRRLDLAARRLLAADRGRH